MDLSNRAATGFVQDNETFCCQGCAEGTGCTCKDARIPVRKAGNRPGDIGQRNPENSVRDNNDNQEVSTSGVKTGMNKQESAKGPAAKTNRGDKLQDGQKAPRSQSEERPSTREQARGRSELRGKLNKRVNRGGEHIDRVSKT